MEIICLDLEGVLVPEVWINFAQQTGISELRRTTRDEPDYDVLMRGRLKILDQNGLKLPDIQDVIGAMAPFPGARDFIDRLQTRYQVVILSDTFYEFARPLMEQLNWPTLFCHRLEIDIDGRVTGYRLRMPNHKQEAVKHFKQLNFKTIAAGDSYNDITMLGEADQGILFQAPDNIAKEFPQFPVVDKYCDFMNEIDAASARLRGG